MNTTTKASIFSLEKNRKIKIFLIFLVLTSIIWLLIELSKSYNSIAVFKVQYENVPSEKLLQNTIISDVGIVLKAPGFSQFRYKAKEHNIKFNLRKVSKYNGKYYFLPNAQLSYLNDQFPADVEVLNVLTDTIFVELGENISKKVPVRTKVHVNFKLGYNFVGNLKSIPDSILVTGPEKYIDSILEISTNSLELNEVYETINTTLRLRLPVNNDLVKLSANEVQIVGEVDKFTEGNLNIPVVIINEPEGVKVNPFPKEIQVIYQIGLSNFNKINKDSFSIVYDYNQYKNDSLTRYLTPVILQKSDLIYSVKLIPSQIEFLIQK